MEVGIHPMRLCASAYRGPQYLHPKVRVVDHVQQHMASGGQELDTVHLDIWMRAHSLCLSNYQLYCTSEYKISIFLSASYQELLLATRHRRLIALLIF